MATKREIPEVLAEEEECLSDASTLSLHSYAMGAKRACVSGVSYKKQEPKKVEGPQGWVQTLEQIFGDDLQTLRGRHLRVQTACSGTGCPVLGLKAPLPPEVDICHKCSTVHAHSPLSEKQMLLQHRKAGVFWREW